MSVVQTLIGNIKGPQGSQGIQGETGAAGAAASVTVGSTTTTAYGNAASVTNSGTSSAAVLDFVIPQGKPGEATTKMGDLLLDSITSSAADFPSPQVGDTGKTAFGKIVKFFSDTISKFTQHEGDIATISTSPTTRSFSKGDYLVYEGTLYKVTANIANGGTLTVGTNITATSAGGELTSLNTALDGLVEIETFTGSTDASGFASLGVSAATYTVLSAYCSGSSYMCIPFVASSNNNWRALVMDITQTPKASTSVTIKYARIKKA